MRGGQADRFRELDVAGRGNVGRCSAKLQEGHVSPALVAELQAPRRLSQDRVGFDHPSVASKAVLGLDTTVGALAQDEAEATLVVTLVGIESRRRQEYGRIRRVPFGVLLDVNRTP